MPKQRGDREESPSNPRDIVTDPQLIAQAREGRDWPCPYCGGQQRNSNNQCLNCGNTIRDDGVWSCEQCASSRRSEDGSCASCGHGKPSGPTKLGASDRIPVARSFSPSYFEYVPLPTRESRFNWLGLVIGILIFAVMVGFLSLIIRTHDVEAVVEEIHWSHTIDIERLYVTPNDGFDPPNDARDIREIEERQNGTKKVKVDSERRRDPSCGIEDDPEGTPFNCKDLENGFEECELPKRNKVCEVPVYEDRPNMQTYYSWKEYNWRLSRSVHESGNTTQTSWPQVGERESSEVRFDRHASYQTTFEDDEGNRYAYHPSETEFKKLPKGTRRCLGVNAFKQVMKVKSSCSQ